MIYNNEIKTIFVSFYPIVLCRSFLEKYYSKFRRDSGNGLEKSYCNKISMPYRISFGRQITLGMEIDISFNLVILS